MPVELRKEEEEMREHAHLASELEGPALQVVAAVDVAMDAMEALDVLLAGSGDARGGVSVDDGFDPSRIEEAMRDARRSQEAAKAALAGRPTLPGTVSAARAALETGSALAVVAKTLHAAEFRLAKETRLDLDRDPGTCLSDEAGSLSRPEDVLGLAADIVAGATGLAAAAMEFGANNVVVSIVEAWEPVARQCTAAAEDVMGAARSIAVRGGHGGSSLASGMHALTLAIAGLSARVWNAGLYRRCARAMTAAMELARAIALHPNGCAPKETLSHASGLVGMSSHLSQGYEWLVSEAEPTSPQSELDDLAMQAVLAAGPLSDLARTVLDAMEPGADDPDGTAMDVLWSVASALDAIAVLLPTTAKREVLDAAAELMPRVCAVVGDAHYRTMRSTTRDREELELEKRAVRSACEMAATLCTPDRHPLLVLRKVMAAAIHAVAQAAHRVNHPGWAIPRS